MRQRPCPMCQSSRVASLDDIQSSLVTYYRCGHCDGVWTFPQGREATATASFVKTGRQVPGDVWD